MDDDKPPLFGSWRRAYSIVLITLVAFIALFAVATWHYQ
jgi:hypothetical protein